MEGSIDRVGQREEPRRFWASLGASGGVHAGVLVAAGLIARFFGGGVTTHGATSEVHVVRNAPAPLAEFRVHEEVLEPVEVEEPVEDPRLIEAPRVEEPLADLPDDDLVDVLSGETLVTKHLAWHIERVEPAESEPEIAGQPVELQPAEIEIALEGDDVVRASVLEAPAPKYPRLAIRNGETGTVTCRLHVSCEGLVTRVEIVESSGFERLDEAAVMALRHWRFVPRTVAGRAEATTILHPVTFVLE